MRSVDWLDYVHRTWNTRRILLDAVHMDACLRRSSGYLHLSNNLRCIYVSRMHISNSVHIRLSDRCTMYTETVCVLCPFRPHTMRACCISIPMAFGGGGGGRRRGMVMAVGSSRDAAPTAAGGSFNICMLNLKINQQNGVAMGIEWRVGQMSGPLHCTLHDTIVLRMFPCKWSVFLVTIASR